MQAIESLWKTVGVLTLGLALGAHAELELFVGPDAAAGGDGSRTKPFGSLQQARDGLRALRKEGLLKSGEAVTVSVLPGVYRMTASFELTAGDGGTEKAPVVYRAAGPGKSRMQGGPRLDPAAFLPVRDQAVRSRLDESARDHVLVAELGSLVPGDFTDFKTAFRGSPSAPWLYVDHQPMTVARWPNVTAGDAGWAEFDKAVDTGLPQVDAADPARRKLHPGAFVCDDPRPARWNIDEGVWLLGYWTHDWSDEVIRIASYDPGTRTIRLAAPHGYGIKGGTWGAAKRRFYAMNVLDELDAPGEWYLDRRNKRLYLYPDGDLSGAEIVLATMTQPLVKVNGAKHLKLEGLGFEYVHADGILASGTEHLEIVGCEVANLAGSGIVLHGSASTIRSCDVFHIGRGGISLDGGDRMTLTPAGNVAENNHVHHYGHFQRTYAPGIGVHGCGQIVRNNCIHDAPHNAILYGGNEHRFECNEIYRVVLETGDAGAFYTGRDWTSRGNVLRHNYIHDLGGGDAGHVNTMGIYLDDCDCGDTLEGNVFFRAGRALMIGGGRDNPVLNNLVLDCPIGLHLDSRGMTWKQWNSESDTSWQLEKKAERFHYTRPPWSTHYPRLAAIMRENPREPLGNTIRRNVFVNCSKQVANFDGNVQKLLGKLEIADNLAVFPGEPSGGKAPEPPAAGFDLRFGVHGLPEAPAGPCPSARDLGVAWQRWLEKEAPFFETIPFDRIGLYKDGHRRELPTRQP